MFISPSFQLLTDLGLTKDWQEARQKLLASIPSSLQKNADDVGVESMLIRMHGDGQLKKLSHLKFYNKRFGMKENYK